MNNIMMHQVLRYRLSSLVALIWFLELLLQRAIVFHNETNPDGFIYERHYALIVVLTGFLFFFVYIAESAFDTTWKKIAASLSVVGILIGLFFLWRGQLQDMSFNIRVLVILSTLVWMGRPDRWKDDNSVWSWQNSVARAGVESVVVSLSFLAFVMLALYLFDFVFEAGPYKNIYPFYAGFNLVPCVVFITRMAPQREKNSKFLAMIVTYFLTPLWLFYVGLLNIYAIKILFQWELPRGAVVTPVAISFGIYVAVWWGLKHLRSENALGWPSARLLQVTKILHLPLLALMVIAIIRRINDHGLTQPRYFIVLLALLFSLVLFLDAVKRLNARNFALVFLGCSLLSFLPVT